MQHRILERAPLLDSSGGLKTAGYATQLLPVYYREAIKAPGFRIKEWDYYLIGNDRYAVALTIADNSYMGLDSVSLLDFESKWEKTVSPMQAFTFGRKKLPQTSMCGDVRSSGRGYDIIYENRGSSRTLTFRLDNFSAGKPIEGKLELECPPTDSMVIATPFPSKKRAFYFNQKINCMPASGVVSFDGRDYLFKKEDSFAVLDWGRGVWTYKNTWYWGSASGLYNALPFGFNIGYGFGDTSAASENMLFYGGQAHKLSQVTFNIPMKDGQEDYLSPWTFTSDDGRFEMDFNPILDRKSNTNVLIISSDQHQVFGRYTGKAVLDDGTELKIKDLTGFAEKVINKW